MRGGVSELTKLATAAFLGGLYVHLPIFALYFVGEGVPLSLVVTAQVFYAVACFLGEIPRGTPTCE